MPVGLQQGRAKELARTASRLLRTFARTRLLTAPDQTAVIRLRRSLLPRGTMAPRAILRRKRRLAAAQAPAASAIARRYSRALCPTRADTLIDRVSSRCLRHSHNWVRKAATIRVLVGTHHRGFLRTGRRRSHSWGRRGNKDNQGAARCAGAVDQAIPRFRLGRLA
jgi:hypothetical protein